MKLFRCSDECRISKPPIDKECGKFEKSKKYLEMKRKKKISQNGVLVKIGIKINLLYLAKYCFN